MVMVTRSINNSSSGDGNSSGNNNNNNSTNSSTSTSSGNNNNNNSKKIIINMDSTDLLKKSDKGGAVGKGEGGGGGEEYLDVKQFVKMMAVDDKKRVRGRPDNDNNDDEAETEVDETATTTTVATAEEEEEELIFVGDSPLSPPPFLISNVMTMNEKSFDDLIDEDYDGDDYQNNNNNNNDDDNDEGMSEQNIINNNNNHHHPPLPPPIPSPALPPLPPPPPPPPQQQQQQQRMMPPVQYWSCNYDCHYNAPLTENPHSQIQQIEPLPPPPPMFQYYDHHQYHHNHHQQQLVSTNNGSVIESLGSFASYQQPEQPQALTTTVVGQQEHQIEKFISSYRRKNVLEGIVNKLESVTKELSCEINKNQNHEEDNNDVDDDAAAATTIPTNANHDNNNKTTSNPSAALEETKGKKASNKRRNISPIRSPTSPSSSSKKPNQKGTDEEEKEKDDEEEKDCANSFCPPPEKRQRTMARNSFNDEITNDKYKSCMKDLPNFMTAITNNFNYYYMNDRCGMDLTEYNKSDVANMMDVEKMLCFYNEIKQHFLNKKEGNIFRVKSFPWAEKKKLQRIEYYAHVYALIELSKLTPKDRHIFEEDLASLNVVYYRANLSYLYADYCYNTNMYKVAIVDKHQNLNYIGEIAPKLFNMIMFAHTSFWH